MISSQFDGLIHSLAGSRRAVFGGSAALISSWFGLSEAGAKKKRKRKHNRHKPKAKPNAYGCLNVGQACNGDSTQCCSGICDGAKPKKEKRDTSRCVAHNAGGCTADTNSCDLGLEVPCNPSNPRSLCWLTTGNAGFCADLTEGSKLCRDCRQDTDCQEEFGPGAACVFLGGVCTPYCLVTGRTACIPAGI